MTKKRIALQNKGERQVSTEDRSAEHGDYLYRGRTNCNDDRRSWRMDNAADSQIGSKQKHGLHCKWTVKRKNLRLLMIEALNTTITLIDDIQITMSIERQCLRVGENQLRLGVIYWHIG